MTDENPQPETPQPETPQPQPDKPVPKEVLDRLREIMATRSRLGLQLLDLESEKIFLLASARRLDDERSNMFAALLTERGHTPDTPAQIDPETGVLRLL